MEMKYLFQDYSTKVGDYSDETFGIITDWTIFSLLVLIEGYVFLKLRFKLDTSGLLVLLLHFFVSILRILNHYLDFNTPTQISLNLLGTYLIWFSLYYFTLEMMLITNLLTQ